MENVTFKVRMQELQILHKISSKESSYDVIVCVYVAILN